MEEVEAQWLTRDTNAVNLSAATAAASLNRPCMNPAAALRGHRPWPVCLLLALVLAVAGCGREAANTEQFQHKISAASAYKEQGKLAEAVDELNGALQIRPADLQVRAMLGDLYMALGNAADADREYRRVQDGRGDPRLYLVKLGDALLRLHEWQEVLDRIRPDPTLSAADRARIRAQRGSAYLGQKDIDAAREEFSAASELDPKCVPASLGQVAMAMSEGRNETAPQLLERVRSMAQGEDAAEAWRLTGELERLGGDPAGAEAAYGKAIESSAFKGTLRIARALVRIDVADYSGAREDLNAVADRYPHHPDVLYGEGLLAIREGRFAEARDVLETLKRIMPESTQGTFYLAVAYLAEGEFRDAEQYLTQVVAKSHSAKAAMLLGRARYALGDYRRAAQVLEPLLAAQPNDPELQGLLGSVYIASGETALGSKLLRNAVDGAPERQVTDRMRLGLSLVSLGDGDAGVRELRRVAAEDPESDQARVALMIAYVQAGNFNEARAIARRLRDANPKLAGPWNYLGMVELAAGNLSAAGEAFNQAYERAPGWSVAGYNLAHLAQTNGNVDRARAIYKEVLQKHPRHLRVLLALTALEAAAGKDAEATELAERAMRFHPHELAPRLWLARAALAEGDVRKSLALFQQVEKQYRDDPGFLALLGETQLLAGETLSGAKTFETLTELLPKDADARYNYARARAIDGDYLGLGEAIVKGLFLDPDHPAVPWLVQRLIDLSSGQASTDKLLWRMQSAAPRNLFLVRVRAEYALRNGRARDAVDIYRAALDGFPKEWQWWGQLPYARARNGDFSGALADIRQWLATHPKETGAWLLRGKVLAAAGKPSEAREAYEHVLTLDRDNVQALNNLAWSLRDTDTAQARRYADRAVALGPDYVTRDTLGVILQRLGKRADAERLLRQAYDEPSHTPEVGFHLARVLVELDRKSEARSLLEEVLQDKRAFADRGRAETLLRGLDG